MCRSTLKATNLSLTVVSLFVVTNLPYVVDEFIRQKILTDAWCDSTFCDTVEVPFLFLWLFTKYFFLLASLTQNLQKLIFQKRFLHTNLDFPQI